MTSILKEPKDRVLTGEEQHLRSEESNADPSTSTFAMAEDTDTANAQQEILSRPILVGYAFGPKKMSTMGMVMAEASKTSLSSVKTTVLVEEPAENDTADDDEDDDDDEVDQSIEGRYAIVYNEEGDENDHFNCSSPACQSHLDCQEPPKVVAFSDQTVKAPPVTSSNTPERADETTKASSDNASDVPRKKSQPRRFIPADGNANIVFSLDSYSGGLKNIVRYLHSSCSSVDTNSTSTTLLTTGTTITAVTPSSASTCGKLGTSASGKDTTENQQRLRVSFVPLDPDIPLDGQHGAELDVVLHKLTEDILCLSKFSHQYPALVQSLGKLNGDVERMLEELQPRLPQDAKAATMRVHRLMQYHKKHPECSLADDPSKVLTLMSRSDIAHTLADCLVGVTSASGIPVASPKYLVCDAKEGVSKEQHTKCIAERLQKAQMTYPLIAKPLQAAGTKVSHQMTVLLNKSSLEHIHSTPCLLQEYANHDAVLYKVYVLGNNVRVYQRPSLPNLPPISACKDKESDSSSESPSYVDFDSQRPYPRLSAFGVLEEKLLKGRMPPPFLSSLTGAASPASSSSASVAPVAVTTEEVQPIVDTLKQAFGLELFGFDILITSTHHEGEDGLDDDRNHCKRRMLVVDVNYFPSYKEVSDFPSLLAQYLTQRAIDSRRKHQKERRQDQR